MINKKCQESDAVFLEYLFELGTVRAAAEAMDISISRAKKIVSRNRQAILDMTTDELAMLAPKAVKTMGDAMDEDGTIPKGDVRLKAAGDTLDRIGASKKTTTELEVKTETPIILMPAKDTPETPTIKVSSEEAE